jgi:integrase
MRERAVRTDAEVRALRCPDRLAVAEVFFHDPKLPGFHLRVYPSGRKVFYLLYRHVGRRHRVKVGLYSPPEFGLADARLKANRMLASVTQGDDPAGRLAEVRRTENVGSLYADFDQEVVKRFPFKTRANWRGTSKRLLREIGRLPVSATDEICSRVMDLHKQVGHEEGKEALARRIFQHACRLFRWAIEERRLKPSQFPFAGLKSRFKDKKRVRYYNPEEIQRLIEAIKRAPTFDRCYFLLLWYTGCRRGALASMRWAEIVPDHTSRATWLWYRSVSKNGDPLEIPLSSHAVQVLDELRALTDHMEYVFPARRADGTTGHRSDSWKPVKRLQAESGVEDFKNHDIRRTVSTYLTRNLDVPTDVVTAILNHRLSGPGSNEHYVQALPVRRMRAALEAWGAYLKGTVSDRPLEPESVAS